MRFGLIGAGMMGQEHLQNLMLTPSVSIAAVMDPVASSRDWASGTLGERAASVGFFEDVETMLANAALDAVIVASPNHTHRAVLQPLWGAGLHILCEKPLATTIADAEYIVQRAATHNGVFAVGMEYRFMPPVARFIARVRQGDAGRLIRLSIAEHRFPFLPKVGDWNRFAENTGGTMVEKCCHFFDLMRHIIGAEPVRVYCSGALDVNHKGEIYDGRAPDIIDNAYATVDFADGTRAMLDLCMFAEGSEQQEHIIVIGDEAKLEVVIPGGVITHSKRVPFFAPKEISQESVSVDAAILAAGHHHGATYHQLQSFLGAIAGHHKVAVSAADGLAAVAMGVAAEISARQGSAVAMASLLAG